MNSSHSSISGLLIALVVCLAVGLVVLFVKIIPLAYIGYIPKKSIAKSSKDSKKQMLLLPTK